MSSLLLGLLLTVPSFAADEVRVLVLERQATPDSHLDKGLQRKVRARIDRQQVVFLPGYDAYQAGRAEPDRSLAPQDQRAVVPDSAIAEVEAATAAAAALQPGDLTEDEWALKAHELRDISTRIWFVDRPELRKPLFDLYAQIGRAAEHSNSPAPPFYELVGAMVNYYHYLAGAMAHAEPGLLDGMDPELAAQVILYKDQLDAGTIAPVTLSFEHAGFWSARAFASEFQLFIDGMEVVVTDDLGHFRTTPGRIDIALMRGDSHSMSERIELDKAHRGSGNLYFVRDTAFVGTVSHGLAQQLIQTPCAPELDSKLANDLAIYSRLNPGELYLTLADERGTPVWRWNPETASAEPVGQTCD